MSTKVDVLVVGAGFAGAVTAERLASAGARVLVLDRRPHVGGNAFDQADEHGVLVHRYGPHIFHTNAPAIADYLSRFTSWRPYEHRVLASARGMLLPIPINRTTINRVFGTAHDEAGVVALLERLREPRASINTAEDAVVAAVGRELYELFFAGYTRKQWGVEASELSASVTARVPARTNDDDRYFTDRFQAMPADGYSAMFARLLAHPNITVRTSASYPHDVVGMRWDHLVYTGPIDAYFGNRFGRLPYRSLRFEYEHVASRAFVQPAAQVNYPGREPYTRITEFRQLTGQAHDGTTIAREYPSASGEPYYPVPSPASRARYEQYAALARREPAVTFVGRLAQYKYYNMDQVIAAALTAATRIVDGLITRVTSDDYAA